MGGVISFLFFSYSLFLYRFVWLTRHQQDECHDSHACHQAINGMVVFAVFFGSGQQLVKRDKDHNSGNHTENDSEHVVIEKGRQYEVADDGSHWLCQTRQKREPKGFLAAARGVINRYRNRNTLRNVM